MRLVTIPISHYCERARWALDHAGIRYEEDPHLQLFHYRHSKGAGGGKTVPVLVTDEGSVLPDSADIVVYADERAPPDKKLYPEKPAEREQVLELERRHAGTFGVETRRVMYYHFFRWGRGALGFNGGEAPWWERWALYATFPIASAYARRMLEVNVDTMQAGLDVARREFDAVAETLSDGRPFLTGEHFTAADLTFACMSAAVTAPEHYGTPLPAIDECPEETASLLRSFRAHPAGQFALRMFLEQRRVATPS